MLLNLLLIKWVNSNCEVASPPDLVSISQRAFSTPFLFDGAKRNGVDPPKKNPCFPWPGKNGPRVCSVLSNLLRNQARNNVSRFCFVQPRLQTWLLVCSFCFVSCESGYVIFRCSVASPCPQSYWGMGKAVQKRKPLCSLQNIPLIYIGIYSAMLIEIFQIVYTPPECPGSFITKLVVLPVEVA